MDAETWLDAAYWRALCPWLHVGDAELCGRASTRAASLAAPSAAAGAARLAHHGVLLLSPDALWGGAPWLPRLLSRLARGVAAVVRAGHPPNAVLAFDEAWLLQALVAPAVRAVAGGELEPVHDWFVFAVGLAAAAGWPPHRDRPLPTRDAVDASFFAPAGDGRAGDAARRARYVTAWLPLTPATPESSCLYCVPREFDPGYNEGDPPGGPSPLAVALGHVERGGAADGGPAADGATRGAGAGAAAAAAQRVLALPAPPGALVLFTHRLLHWGSAPLQPPPAPAGEPPPPPRLALSFAFADPAYEAPYLAAWPGGERGAPPPPRARLALAAAQALAYAHVTPPRAADAALFLAVVAAARGELAPAYAARAEAAGAWTAFTAAARGRAGGGGGGGPPSARDVAIAFSAYERAADGLDATRYL